LYFGTRKSYGIVPKQSYMEENHLLVYHIWILFKEIFI